MARLFTNSFTFAEIAVKHFLSGEEAYQKLLPLFSQEDADAMYQRSLLEMPAEQEFSISICFSAMALEAFIYDYAARNLGDGYVSKYLDKLDLTSKWLVIPRLITGSVIDPGCRAINLLRELVQERNRLVRSKSKAVSFTPEFLEWFAETQSYLPERLSALKGLMAVYHLAALLDGLDGEAHARFSLSIGSCYNADNPADFTMHEDWASIFPLFRSLSKQNPPRRTTK